MEDIQPEKMSDALSPGVFSKRCVRCIRIATYC